MYERMSYVKEILSKWDQAIEIYQDFQDEVVEAIRGYEEIQEQNDEVRYCLLEAEDRIAELEAEIERLHKELASRNSLIAGKGVCVG